MSAESQVSGTVLAGLLLGAFVLLGTLLVTGIEQGTRERIDANEREWVLRSLNEIVPDDRYDNTLSTDTVAVADEELLGSAEPLTVYRARAGGEPVAAILEAVAPDGYAGEIRLLVGIEVDGTLAGVRIARHQETPGLGDAIEAAKTDWILAFAGRSLANTPAAEWAVRSDGGRFDQFTGATVTPRAVVRAVHRALIYFDANRDTLFADTGDTDDDST